MRIKIQFPVIVVLIGMVLLGCPSAVTSPTDTIVNIAAIPGVTAPVTGTTPVETITETAQYTGTLSWSPAVPTTFWSGTNYTATITLTAKAGYTLNGVAADFFIIAGVTSNTNPANSAVVTAVFPATAANLAAVTDYTDTGVGTLKAVQGGTFNNGTVNMTVSSFRMSQYEVTRAQFLAIMGSDPSNTTYASGMNDPVQMVSSYHAIAFCNKLSLTEGLTPVYSVTTVSDWAGLTFASIPTWDTPAWNAAVADWSANGYRLPTEAEWKFAARGGNSSNNYTYSGSNTIGAVAVFGYYGSEEGRTTTQRSNSVGSKVPNELGLYDMTGNVSEWSWDWWSSYPGTELTDYRGPASGTYRFLHGGSWGSDESSCTVAKRGINNPYFQYYGFGFRVVRN